MQKTRSIALTPRLRAVREMLPQCEIVADIGTDHGRLAVSLLQVGIAKRVIAADISKRSLAKAVRLAKLCELDSLIDFCVGDGFYALDGALPDCTALCGMGGETIAAILNATPDIARRQRRIVMQPMRAEAELRHFLCSNSFCILEERVVREGDRFYQIISAVNGACVPPPKGWPSGYYQFGWVGFESNEQLLPLVRHYVAVLGRKLDFAASRGGSACYLALEIEKSKQIINMLEGGFSHAH